MRIETDRLLLRPFEPGDYTAVHAMQTDPDVTRYLLFDVRDDAGVRRSFDLKVAATELRKEGDVLSFAVMADGELVGDATYIWTSKTHQTGEIGYVFIPAYQGKGYATESAKALLRMGFEDHGMHRIIGRCDARNTASAGVLERIGMRREAHFIQNEWIKDEWTDELVYAMLVDEWRAASANNHANSAL